MLPCAVVTRKKGVNKTRKVQNNRYSNGEVCMWICLKNWLCQKEHKKNEDDGAVGHLLQNSGKL